MIRKDYIDEITRSLAVLKAEVELSNPSNFTDINIHAENFYRDFLNILYDYRLENLNAEQQNTAGCDLGDEKNRIAIQVTSTSSLQKTKDTVIAFVKAELDKKYDRLIILNIVKKSKHRERKVGKKGGFFD
ncbi:MAG: SMEK domain-containing protein [Kangiellaceae bacterium]|nr:SMEK domain-containing protein [Kangiellaceae bacterium]